MPDVRATTLRLFVAIELPEPVRRALERMVGGLVRAGATEGVRWVRPEGIHLTLKFLGAVAGERVAGIERAVGEAADAAVAFDLGVGVPGSFGGRRNLRVVWASVGGDTAALATLAEGVDEALAALGFDRERRAFAAHITLGRVRDDAPPSLRERLYEAVRQAPPETVPTLRVTSISLMRSTLGAGGAKYDAIATFPLREP